MTTATFVEAKQALRVSEERYALATAAAGVGVWEWELATNAMFIDPSLKAMLGYSDHEIKNHMDDWSRHRHRDDFSRVAEMTRTSVQKMAPDFDVEHRMLHKNGSVRWFHSHATVLRNKAGRAIRLIGTETDITKRKESEIDLQQHRQELIHLSRVASLGALSSALAHELNQPLGAILSNAQAALRYLDREPPNLAEVREILSDIAKQDQRAGEVIRHMRLLLKRGQPQFVSIDLNLLVSEVVRLIRSEIMHRSTSIDLLLGPDLAEIPGDRVPLQQVLINLLLNASEAMQDLPPAQRRIQIRTHQRKGTLVAIDVVDCGHGINADDIRRLFIPFFTTKTQGLGIGLAICKSIADAHGGRLWAENNPGQGATFHLELPVGPASDPVPFPNSRSTDELPRVGPLAPEYLPHAL